MSGYWATLQAPPPQLLRHGTPALGAYNRGIPLPDLTAPWYRLKRWHYVSWTTERFMLVAAVVDVGYLGNMFAYLLDLQDPTAIWQTEGLSPLGTAANPAVSSLSGTTSWQQGQNRIALHGQAAADGSGRWHWDLDIKVRRGQETRRLQATVEAIGEDALALVHALPGDRTVYTHKEAGQRAQGSVAMGDLQWQGSGLATLDWTRGHHLRTTRWKWACLVGMLADGRRVGLNLSAEVYDDAAGNSAENALWLDGQAERLAGVQFALPRHPDREPWQIRSIDAGVGEVDLRFVPWGARRQDLDIGLVVSRYVQPYGTFSGQIRTAAGQPLAIDGLVGVVEDHLARW